MNNDEREYVESEVKADLRSFCPGGDDRAIRNQAAPLTTPENDKAARSLTGCYGIAMGIWTDWYIAPPSAGATIASRVTDEPLDCDWPVVSLKLGEMELHALWAALRGDDDLTRSTMGDLVYQESEECGPWVTQVQPEFVEALASVPATKFSATAAEWKKCGREELYTHDWTLEDATHWLSVMAAFARDAVRAKTPVLQLNFL